MARRRLIALCVVALLLIGGAAIVSWSEVQYRVSLSTVVQMWGDVLRDADRVGLSLTRVSDRTEMELGAALAKGLERSVVTDPTLQRYVDEVGSRLAGQVKRKGIAYTFRVIEMPSINAFALPGGYIFITRKMVDFVQSEAELAAVIAHEISHVDLRHSIERLQYELFIRRILPSDLAAISRLPYSLVLVAYSEQEEREADIDAVLIMAKAGYHPKYGLVLSDRMGTLEKDVRRTSPPTNPTQELATAVWDALREYFQTHPPWSERTSEIIGVLSRNGAKWKDQTFYVGRSNHAQRISRETLPLDAELRPYVEPPVFAEYLSTEKYSHFKAMAAHLPSGLSAIAADEATPSAAIEHAISECAKKIKPCQLYALGDTIVLNMPQHEIDAVASKYLVSGQFERTFKSYLRADDFKALSVDLSSGMSGTSTGLATLSAAVGEALARCSEQGRTCTLYAVGDVIVHGLSQDQVDAAIDQYQQRIVADRIAKLQASYLEDRAQRDFKALAVDYHSGKSAVAQAQATPSQAIEQAVAACSTPAVTCELHAIGSVIVRAMSRDERDTIAKQYGREVIERMFAAARERYESRNDYKTFVVDVPKGVWAHASGHWHPLASLNTALMRCKTRGANCQLAALGDTFVFDTPTSSLTAQIDEYWAGAVWPSDRRNPVREYISEARFADFKAFAAVPPRRSWQREWGYDSPYKAAEQTVALCRERNPACELYAIGNHIVYGESEEQKKAVLALYAREVIEKKLRSSRWPAYADFKAVAGNPETMKYTLVHGRPSPRDAIEEAMRECIVQYTRCQLFALGDAAVFDLAQERIDQIAEQYQRDVSASRGLSN